MSKPKDLDVDLSADWLRYATPMAGFTILGVVHWGGENPGALAYNAQADTYVKLNGAALTVLDRDEVVVAPSLAQHRKRAQSD
jgi:hypothetical protein